LSLNDFAEKFATAVLTFFDFALMILKKPASEQANILM